MKKICSCIVVMLAMAILACGQQKPAPSGPAQQPQATEDISGMYTFLRDGEFVQVSVDAAGVTGFVSRYGDSDTDKGTFLDQFFDKGSLNGDKLTWITKPVHDTWFEFAGTVARGPGKTPNDEAYRVLQGKLTIYKKDASGKTTSTTRDVEFKSFPADVE